MFSMYVFIWSVFVRSLFWIIEKEFLFDKSHTHTHTIILFPSHNECGNKMIEKVFHAEFSSENESEGKLMKKNLVTISYRKYHLKKFNSRIKKFFFLFLCICNWNFISLFSLHFPDAPVCTTDKTVIVGAYRSENLNVVCEVHADPPPRSFRWKFNSSGESYEIPKERLFKNGSQSSILHYTPIMDQDYGTLTCVGQNEVGEQTNPCVFQVILAGRQWLDFLLFFFTSEHCLTQNQIKKTFQTEKLFHTNLTFESSTSKDCFWPPHPAFCICYLM